MTASKGYTAYAQHDAASIVVTTTAELSAALKQLAAGSGGTILLDGAGGPYDIIAFHLGSSATPILIGPLDPDVPPVIHEMKLTSSSYIAVTGMYFDGATTPKGPDIKVNGGRNVEIVGNTMHGTADGFLSEDGTATQGNSLASVRASSNMLFSDNTVSNYLHGFGVLDSTGLIFTNNDVSQLQGDGFRGGGLNNAVISDNHMHDFLGSTQTMNHSDMIQLWGTWTQSPNRDITISGNLLDAGNDAATQGIFIMNEWFSKAGSPAAGYFQNISITDNVVHNAAPNGIAVSHTQGLEITNNTVLWDELATTKTKATSPGKGVAPWIAVSNTPDAKISGNISDRLLVRDKTLVLEDVLQQNLLLSYTDPTSDTYAYDIFVNLGYAGDFDSRDLMLRADSPFYGNFGARSSSYMDPDSSLTAAISPQVLDGNVLAIELSAENSQIHGTGVAAGTLTAVWTFEDGSQQIGTTTQRVFDQPGDHLVRLDISDGAGNTDTVIRTIHVDDPVLFDINFSNNGQDFSGHASQTSVNDPQNQGFVAGLTGEGFHLTGSNAFRIDNSNQQIYALDRFDIDFAVRMDTAMEYGGLLDLHSILGLSVEKTGALSFKLVTDAGHFAMKTAAGVMSNTAWHDVNVHYDTTEALMSLSVDGVTLAQSAATGTTASQTPWSLVVGAPWAVSVHAVVDDLVMTEPTASTFSAISTPPVPQAPPVLADTFLFDIDFSENGTDQSAFETKTVFRGQAADAFVSGQTGEGFHLTAGTGFQITRDNDHLSNLDAFTLNMSVKMDTAGDKGGLVSLHTIADLDVLDHGVLRFKLETDAGNFVMKTAAGVLSDTDWHDISVRYSDAAGDMSLLVDDIVVAASQASGTTAALSHWSLSLGEPWGVALDAVIDDYSMTVPGSQGVADSFDLFA